MPYLNKKPKENWLSEQAINWPLWLSKTHAFFFCKPEKGVVNFFISSHKEDNNKFQLRTRNLFGYLFIGCYNRYIFIKILCQNFECHNKIMPMADLWTHCFRTRKFLLENCNFIKKDGLVKFKPWSFNLISPLFDDWSHLTLSDSKLKDFL